jgi:CRISPR/Cas system Type II protein with McrA/HNH and RuvC-like nuclease domain
LRSSHHWRAIRAKFEAQGGRCAYTGQPLILGLNDSLDHVYPVSRYPARAEDPANIEWTTREVNQMKRDRTPAEFLALLKVILDYRG